MSSCSYVLDEETKEVIYKGVSEIRAYAILNIGIYFTTMSSQWDNMTLLLLCSCA